MGWNSVPNTACFSQGDKPRLSNTRSEDMVLEDEVVSQIAQRAELLAVPKADGGFGDTSAFHALMLLIRTGRHRTTAEGGIASQLIGVRGRHQHRGDPHSIRTSERSTPPTSRRSRCAAEAPHAG